MRPPFLFAAVLIKGIMVCALPTGCAVVVALAATVAQGAPEPGGAATETASTLRQMLPPDLPLDADGIPTRQLSDDELFRLLVALSSQNEAAAMRLADCHASGRSYGHPGWRNCVVDR